MTHYHVLVLKHGHAEWYNIESNNSIGARKEAKKYGKVIQIDIEEPNDYNGVRFW